MPSTKDKLPLELQQPYRDTEFKIEKGVPLGELRARYGVFKETLENMRLGDSVELRTRRDLQGFYRAAYRMKIKVKVEVEWQNSEYAQDIRARLWRLSA